MLSFKERQNVLAVLRYFTIVNRFPARVEVQHWTVRPGTGKRWKDWLSKGWFALFTLHALYKILTLLHVFLFVPATPLYQIIIHSLMTAGSVTFGLWYYILYIEYADEFATLIRTTLRGNI